jgi:hypothetical protein
MRRGATAPVLRESIIAMMTVGWGVATPVWVYICSTCGAVDGESWKSIKPMTAWC